MARHVEAELSHPVVWTFVRRVVRDQFPDDPSLWLSEQPMRRHRYLYGRRRCLAQPGILDALTKRHREFAARQAREVGLLDPERRSMV
jgi:hypothetical protein